MVSPKQVEQFRELHKERAHLCHEAIAENTYAVVILTTGPTTPAANKRALLIERGTYLLIVCNSTWNDFVSERVLNNILVFAPRLTILSSGFL